MSPDELFAQIEALDEQASNVAAGPGADFWTRSAEVDEQRADLWKQIAQHAATSALPRWTGHAALIASLTYTESARLCRCEARR